MKTSGLTEKKMANKRYRETEYAIFHTFYRLKDCYNANRIAKAAGISRTTLFRHHKRVQAISSDYEDFLIIIYARTIKRFLCRDITLKKLFFRTLIFIISNKLVITALIQDGHQSVIKKMLEILKPRIIAEWHLSGDSDKMYSVYANSILGVIETWSKHGFTERSIGQVLSDILYLTSIAHRELLPIQHEMV